MDPVTDIHLENDPAQSGNQLELFSADNQLELFGSDEIDAP